MGGPLGARRRDEDLSFMVRIALPAALATGLAALVSSFAWTAPRPPRDFPAREEFRGVDTSRLMGSPDPIPPLAVEPAFPGLPKFNKPVALGAIAGTDRL